ncbi:MAG: leucine-rich repeat domain-containing protein [bacterium]|nr:leucine-rich repeat domain-containing protein [bacterium]
MRFLSVIIFIVLFAAITGYVIGQKKTDSAPIVTTETSKGGVIAVPSRNTLDLSGQGLIKTPEYIFTRIGLEELDLSDNALDGALQSQVGQLRNLKVLDLSNNNFTGVPAEVGQLRDLEVLDLSDNLLTGLPYELGNLSKLKVLDLSGNKYSKVDLAEIKKKLPSSVLIKTD